MNILYKQGTSVGIRYPRTFFGVLFRLVLVGLFFKVTYVFINGRMSWDNWLIPVFFIFGLLMLGMNKRKAAYNRKTHRLTIYGEAFNPIGQKYELPPLKEDISIYTQQRIDYHNANGRRSTLLFNDIILKMPHLAVELDSVLVKDDRDEKVKKDWEKFFSVIYDPKLTDTITGGPFFFFAEIGLWCVLIICSLFALLMNIVEF